MPADEEIGLDSAGESWADPAWVRELIRSTDAEIEAEEPDDPHVVWLGKDRQRRLDDWAATFFAAGIVPPDGWQAWVK